MKTTPACSLALLLFPLTALAPRDDLRVSPQEGLRLQRTYSEEVTIALDEFEVLINGEDPGMDAPEFDLERGWSQTSVIVDHIVESDDERPLRLERTYEELAQTNWERASSEEGDFEEEDPQESELEGKTVVFVWDEDDEEYSLELEEGGDDDLLDHLREDLDLRSLFVGGDYSEEGSRWSWGDEEMQALFDWAGALKLRGEEETEEDDELGREIIDSIEGDGKAELVSLDREDDGLYATIEFTFDAETEVEIEGEADEVFGGSSLSRITVIWSGEGEAVWNLRGGYLASLEYEADVEMIQAVEQTFQSPEGEEAVFEQTMMFEGTSEVSIETELAKRD